MAHLPGKKEIKSDFEKDNENNLWSFVVVSQDRLSPSPSSVARKKKNKQRCGLSSLRPWRW